jgi:hypothetical protein
VLLNNTLAHFRSVRLSDKTYHEVDMKMMRYLQTDVVVVDAYLLDAKPNPDKQVIELGRSKPIKHAWTDGSMTAPPRR